MANPIHVTDENFKTEVLKSPVPVIVDFWATWCAPCRLIAPIVAELSQEYDGKIKVCKLDVDNNPNTAIEYGVRSIPTLLFFKNGKVVGNIIGAVGKNVIVEHINRILS
ncbi:MAG: thioredoxin [Candidatus Kapaibacteriales bacterium]